MKSNSFSNDEFNFSTTMTNHHRLVSCACTLATALRTAASMGACCTWPTALRRDERCLSRLDAAARRRNAAPNDPRICLAANELAVLIGYVLISTQFSKNPKPKHNTTNANIISVRSASRNREYKKHYTNYVPSRVK